MFPFFNNYPGTDLHEIDLAYILKVCNEMLDRVRAQDDKIAAVEQLAQELKDFVNNYFDNLDVQEEINNKIDQMAADGSLLEVLEDPAAAVITQWLNTHITPTTPAVDSSLTVSGAAADAKTVGDRAVLGSGRWTVSGGPSLTDADTASANTIYAVPFSNRTANTPAGKTGNLITFAYQKEPVANWGQLFIDSYGRLYSRSKWSQSDPYSEWYAANGWSFVVRRNGGGDYNNIKEAVEEAIKHENATVYIRDGVYDLIEEFGTEYMESHEFSASDRGIELYNGINLIFDSAARVTCNYTGANSTVNKFFSPFNIKGSCAIHNMNLNASNVRYAIHDEMGGVTTPYTVKYSACNITFDNSQNPNWLSKKIIGGGLGKFGQIYIENCIFNPVNIDRAGIESGVVTYHNNSAAGSASTVIIRDCYFVKSTFSIRWYGNSTLKTIAICTNNRVTYPPQAVAETSSSTIENVVLYAWNNLIETA